MSSLAATSTDEIQELKMKQHRTLVLCFDGTSNEYDGDNTNVVKLFSLLKKDDMKRQLCYYQPGIGTYFAPGVVAPMFEWAARMLDFAIAWYLDVHVMNGYKFLMQNYLFGDKICIFGFSRGAYTARALAGMLFKIGLLPKDNLEQIHFAYKLYKRRDEEGKQLAAGFKQTYCHPVRVEFMGVWDTVSSVGLLAGRTLPFTNSNNAVKTFRHALSLDERRARFRPNLYHRQAPNAAAAAKDPEHASFAYEQGDTKVLEKNQLLRDRIRHMLHRRREKKMQKRKKLRKMLPEKDEIPPGPTDVMEVWFAGCHSDVGGGAVVEDVDHNLANIPLRWMIRQIIHSQCGILFNDAAMKTLALPLPAALQTKLDDGRRSPAAQRVYEKDVHQPIHDNIKLKPYWWLLELIPQGYSWQDPKGVWHRDFGFNLAKGRKIPDIQPNFHSSVKERSEKLGYKPKARWQEGSEVYVD